MDVFFLEARVALTKRYVQLPDGRIDPAPYPMVSEFKSHKHRVTTLHELFMLIRTHAGQGHCLIKGILNKDLDWESRAGAAPPDTPTEWMVIDVDGLPDHTPAQVLAKIGLYDRDYIVQYSSSAGVLPSKGLSCHIFLMLGSTESPSDLKNWLIHQNLDHFDEHLRLTASKVALHYPLDVTSCQNDKLIYIAPPICLPPTLDTYPDERIQYVKGPQ